MKNLFLLILSAIILTSCYKDDASPSANSMRIKQIISYDNVGKETMKIEFNYKDSKVTSYKTYEKNSADEYYLISENKYTYSDNKVTESYYTNYNDTEELYSTIEMIFSNNKIIEETESRIIQGAILNSQNWVYTYSGNKLLSWIKTYTDNWATDKEDERFVASYIGDNIDKCTYSSFYTNEWYDYSLNEYSYSGSFITEIIKYRSNLTMWMGDIKYTYTYSQNRLDSQTTYYFIQNSWTETNSYYYEYNNGYPVKMTNNSGVKYEYKYEPGSGNASQILYNSPKDNVQPAITLKSSEQDGKHSIPDAVARVIR